MILLDNQPRLSDIQALIARVPQFPYSVKQLIKLAREEHFPEEVVSFYKAFPPDEVFEDPEDLATRTEQIEIMTHEELGQPKEIWNAPEED
jgi:hypothetical protein